MSTPAVPRPIDDPLIPLRRKLMKAMAGFSGDVAERDWSVEDIWRPDRTEFPVPDLVLFALRNVLGFRWAGYGEKVRWSVYCRFKSVPLSFELRKFGFTVAYPKDAKVDMKRVCGQLRSGVKLVEQWLVPLAQSQIEVGAVTIANRNSEFDDRYRFFRQLADSAYRRGARAARKKAPPDESSDIFAALAKSWANMVSNDRQGFYYSAAMIDAFFSRLEHQLVLLLAFRGKLLLEGELRSFLGSSWERKLKILVDIDSDKKMQAAYAQLKQIKERVRNPFAHGGVENDGGSLFVHIPTIGSLPANFSQFRNSVRFNFLPLESDDHRSACEVFDELDNGLRQGKLARAYTFVESDIDPSFDSSSLATYADMTAASAEEQQDFIDMWHQHSDRHSNMDY